MPTHVTVDTPNASTTVVIRPHIRKSVSDAYLCAFPLGFIGLHRFYLGQPIWGLAYFFSLGFFGLGWLHDLLFMPKIVERANRRLANPQNPIEYSLLEAYALCLSPGGIVFGLHQFYLGRKGFGIGYCFSLGFVGVGWLVDIFRLPMLVAEARQRQQGSEVSPQVAHKKPQKRIDDAYILWIFGALGAHHFYLGNIGFGFAYFFTLGMGGIGWLVDFFRMPVLVKRANADPKSPYKHLDSAYVLTFPLGFLGLQHFYLGKHGLGVAYLLTLGLAGIGFLADLIRMPSLVREINQSIQSERMLAVAIEAESGFAGNNNNSNSNISSHNYNAATASYQSPQPPTDISVGRSKPSLLPESNANNTSNAAAASLQPDIPRPYGPPPAYQSIVSESAPQIPQTK